MTLHHCGQGMSDTCNDETKDLPRSETEPEPETAEDMCPKKAKIGNLVIYKRIIFLLAGDDIEYPQVFTASVL